MSGLLCPTKGVLSRTVYKAEWAPEWGRTFLKRHTFSFCLEESDTGHCYGTTEENYEKKVMIYDSLDQIQSEGTLLASALLPPIPSHHFVFMNYMQ